MSEEDRRNINFSRPSKLGILSDLLEVTEKSRKECIKKRWRYTRNSGETVIFVDLFGKIVKWIDLFKQVGDAAVQYDSVHAALPWAGVRFLLQVCGIKIGKSKYWNLYRLRSMTSKILLSWSRVQIRLRKSFVDMRYLRMYTCLRPMLPMSFRELWSSCTQPSWSIFRKRRATLSRTPEVSFVFQR